MEDLIAFALTHVVVDIQQILPKILIFRELLGRMQRIRESNAVPVAILIYRKGLVYPESSGRAPGRR